MHFFKEIMLQLNFIHFLLRTVIRIPKSVEAITCLIDNLSGCWIYNSSGISWWWRVNSRIVKTSDCGSGNWTIISHRLFLRWFQKLFTINWWLFCWAWTLCCYREKRRQKWQFIRKIIAMSKCHTHSQHHPLILAVPTVDALVARDELEPQMELWLLFHCVAAQCWYPDLLAEHFVSR